MVVGLVLAPAGLEVAHADHPSFTVDGERLVVHPRVEVEPGPEALGRLEHEAVAMFDDPTDVVREAAVGVRHVSAALEHDDLGRRIETAQSGGGGHAAGHATDDHDLARPRSAVRLVRPSILGVSRRPSVGTNVTRQARRDFGHYRPAVRRETLL